jgi:hypothetical protein
MLNLDLNLKTTVNLNRYLKKTFFHLDFDLQLILNICNWSKTTT